MHRKGFVRAAACAALACAGFSAAARAEEAGPATRPAEVGLVIPAYLETTTSARAPLMALLDKAGLAKPLDDAKIDVGGLVEGSWTYSASKPPGNIITGRVFDIEHESVLLNQLELHAERKVEDSLAKKEFDIGGRMEWRWGTDSRFIHSVGLFDHYGFGDGPKNQWDLTQAYLDFAVPVGNGLRLRVGKFTTLLGQEVIDPSGNALYSHSYLFGYAVPFTHTGVLATYALNDGLILDAGVTRGWDTSLEDNNDTVDFLGRVTFKFGKQDDPFTGIGGKDSSVLLTVISGPDQPGDNSHWRTVLDLIVLTKMGDQLSVALNADYGYEADSVSTPDGSTAHWWGVAAYAAYGVNEYWAVNARAEYFNDDDGARLASAVGGAGVFEATLGLAITPFPKDAYGKGLTIRPEIRYDYASKPFFDGGSDRYQFTAAIDAYFKF